MKAIILAAGKGTRLSKYTKDLPKGMLPVFNKSIIEHQIEVYNRNDITDITIVTGYLENKIQYQSTKKKWNERFATTNMVESLLCAEEELAGEVIISYSDVLFEDRLLQQVITSTSDVGVLIDTDWKEYWKSRYGKVDFDTESLKFDTNNNILQLGVEDALLEEIEGRYIGLIKLSSKGVDTVQKVYGDLKSEYKGKNYLNNKTADNISMTEFLQEIINRDNIVESICTKRGWLEFDTNTDYEQVLQWKVENNLARFYKEY